MSIPSTQKLCLAVVGLVVGLAGSCFGSATNDSLLNDDDPMTAHLDLAVAAPVDSQSAGVRVEVFRCGELRPLITGQIRYSAGSLDEFQGFAHTPVLLDKEHLFARGQLSLHHGCYQATAQPLDIHNQPLQTCVAAETPDVQIGPSSERSVLLVARCGDMPSDTPMIGGRLNFGPRLTEVTSRVDRRSGVFEVCAHTFDPEGDQVRVEWQVQTDSGRRIAPGEVWHSAQSSGESSGESAGKAQWRRSACIEVVPTDEPIELTAVARDGLDHSARGFLSFEAYRLYRYGVAAPSRDRKNVRLPLRRSDRPAE